MFLASSLPEWRFVILIWVIAVNIILVQYSLGDTFMPLHISTSQWCLIILIRAIEVNLFPVEW